MAFSVDWIPFVDIQTSSNKVKHHGGREQGSWVHKQSLGLHRTNKAYREHVLDTKWKDSLGDMRRVLGSGSKPRLERYGGVWQRGPQALERYNRKDTSDDHYPEVAARHGYMISGNIDLLSGIFSQRDDLAGAAASAGAIDFTTTWDKMDGGLRFNTVATFHRNRKLWDQAVHAEMRVRSAFVNSFFN